jgi:hypothetical protein
MLGLNCCCLTFFPRLASIRLAYQPPASSTFPSEQTSYQQPASSTFLSEQISTSHQPPAKRTGCVVSNLAGRGRSHPGRYCCSRPSKGPACGFSFVAGKVSLLVQPNLGLWAPQLKGPNEC